MTVLAVKNGSFSPRRESVLQFVEDKASGFGLVRFDKARRKVIVDCWPYLADFTKRDTQMPGWPLEIDVLDNYARKPAGHLPTLKITGAKQPLIEVIDQTSGELVYALRVAQPEFRPHVFAAGKYVVKVSDPDTGKSAELRGLEPASGEQKPIAVRV
jgi:hypothetical protein